MGYRAEKLAIEKKIAIWKRILLAVVAVLLAGLCVFSAFIPPASWKYYVQNPKLKKRSEGEMRIHFIDVGQGDATLIEFPDGKVMLVDGSNGSEGAIKALMRYLNALKIKKIDYLVATHADMDHCGGLDTVLQYKKVGMAFLPLAKPSTNDEYASFYTALLDEECNFRYSSRNLSIVNDEYGYKLYFLYPYALDIEEKLKNEEFFEEQNESSAVLWLDYQGVSTLLTGDAPQSTEETLMRDDKLGLLSNLDVQLSETEIIKISHHGSNDASDEEFLRYLNVQTAVISCGRDNAYGHPNVQTLGRLETVGAEVRRTDAEGNIMLTVKDGKYEIENPKK